MSTTRRKKDPVRLGPKAMTQLLKAARLEIYECLQVAGPLSIAELAARLGRPADSLYYHVRKLRAIGVIEEVELVETADEASLAGRGRPGAVYAVVSKRVDVELDPTSSRSRKAWADGGASVLRLAQRNYARALGSGEVRPEGARRNLLLRRVKVRLDAAQLKEVNQHLDALDELLCGHAENTTGELHVITCLMTPIEEPDSR
jgi:DNA-binding Lrp family transcriptional regulator